MPWEKCQKNYRLSEIFILEDSLNVELFADIALSILRCLSSELQMTELPGFISPQYDATAKLGNHFT